MQLSQLLTLIILALFSTQPAALLQRTAAAAPSLTPGGDGTSEAAGTVDNAAARDSNNNSQHENGEYFETITTDVAPPLNEEDIDISERLTEAPVPVHYILSLATGQFVAITKSGRVQANTQFGRLVAQFTMLYEHVGGREHVSIRSVKYEDRGWFLTVNSKGRVKGSIPSNGNEVFEVFSMQNGANIALKLRQNLPMTEGSGDEDIAAEPCFVGFSAVDGRPSCYSSSRHVETQLLFLDANV